MIDEFGFLFGRYFIIDDAIRQKRYSIQHTYLFLYFLAKKGVLYLLKGFYILNRVYLQTLK